MSLADTIAAAINSALADHAPNTATDAPPATPAPSTPTTPAPPPAAAPAAPSPTIDLDQLAARIVARLTPTTPAPVAPSPAPAPAAPAGPPRTVAELLAARLAAAPPPNARPVSDGGAPSSPHGLTIDDVRHPSQITPEIKQQLIARYGEKVANRKILELVRGAARGGR